jgi:hypothetical protein
MALFQKKITPYASGFDGKKLTEKVFEFHSLEKAS